MKKPNFIIYALLCLGIGTTIKAQYTDLLNFNGTNGATPYGALMLSGNLLYGMTANGGSHGDGNIFAIDTNGNGYSDLFDFNGTNGLNPYGSLTISGTVMYGMTYEGGTHDSGCIFSINTNGSGYTDLYNFNGTNSIKPYGSLTLSGSVLYGMTHGGTLGYGNIFSINTNGSGYQDLHNFNGSNGGNPYGNLTLSGSVLYGMTSGANWGCIFSINTNGSGYQDIHDFHGTNGGSPTGSLTLSGNKLYGMTEEDGDIFSINTNGTGYTELFTGLDIPYGSLTLSNGLFYGMTGGAWYNSNYGNIFSIDTTGNGYSDLLDFNGTNNPEGANPYFGDLSISRAVLYGMTCLGGANNSGVVFRLKNCTLKALTSIVANVSCKGGNNGNVSSVINGGTTPYTYSWTGGAVTATVTGLSAGTYTVIVTDNYSCVSSSSVTITQPSIDGNLLCYATVDTNSEHNIIAWDTTGSNNECIDSVSLFFYNSNNQWQKIGEESYTVADTAKYFVDQFNNPNAVTVRYCVKAVDIYGDTSYFSKWQNTMYVSNSAGTFSWSGTGYLIEGNSMPVLTYYLVRNDTVIDSVSGSQNKITDVNYSPIATYWIKARLNEVTCNLSPIAMGHRPELKDNVTNASRSNIINRKPLGINTIESNKGQLNIYPDPNNGSFTLSLSKVTEKCNVEIYNVLGMKIYIATLLPQTPKGALSEINISNQPSGVYFFRVISESGELVGEGKVIVEK